MTATTYPPTTSPAGAPPAERAVTLRRLVAAEWIKVRSLRSTVWTLIATVVLMVGVAVLAAWGTAAEAIGGGSGPMNGAQLLSAGYQLGQLAIAVLAVLAITGEYSTGMIRSSLAAAPRRTPVLAAKAIVLVMVVLAVSAVSMALSYVATRPFHAQIGAQFDPASDEFQRMTIGLPLYLAAIALLAFTIGALVRSTAGALTLVIGLLLVLENVAFMIPLRIVELVSPLLPATAGRRLLFDAETLASIDASTEGVILAPWQGFAVLAAWVIGLFAIAAVMIRHRDA